MVIIGPAASWGVPPGVADQPYSRKNRSLRSIWHGIADRSSQHSRPRRATLSAIPMVKGVAQRMGIERDADRVHSPRRPNQQVGHRNHICDRKKGDGADELVSGICRRLPGQWKSRSIAELGWYVSSPNQQVDFHIALGLNHNAPNYIVGVGYSVRFDDLFLVKRSTSIALRN